MSYNISPKKQVLKRLFDLFFSFLGLVILFPVILLAFLISSYDTKSNGFFTQIRIGQFGKKFKLLKIKTMKPNNENKTNITTALDNRITKTGRLFRKLKIDELPQLFNVLKGDMSFVGPRPDVPGYADKLIGIERNILNIKPGITGLASLKYAEEEEILASVPNPQEYNDKVIFPDKVRINLNYINNYTLKLDVQIIFKTIFKKYNLKYE